MHTFFKANPLFRAPNNTQNKWAEEWNFICLFFSWWSSLPFFHCSFNVFFTTWKTKFHSSHNLLVYYLSVLWKRGVPKKNTAQQNKCYFQPRVGFDLCLSVRNLAQYSMSEHSFCYCIMMFWFPNFPSVRYRSGEKPKLALSVVYHGSSSNSETGRINYYYNTNTCWVPHLDMIPKHFTMATTQCCSLLPSRPTTLCMQIQMGAIHSAFEYQPK